MSKTVGRQSKDSSQNLIYNNLVFFFKESGLLEHQYQKLIQEMVASNIVGPIETQCQKTT
jgi:hypothetical protein